MFQMKEKFTFTIILFVLSRSVTKTANINHNCQGTISTASDVITELLNVTESCHVVFRTHGKDQILQASFRDFDENVATYLSFVEVYDNDKKEGGKINLDFADGDTLDTIIYSRGPFIFVSISRNLKENFTLNISLLKKEDIEKNSSLYHGSATTPRYLQRRKNAEYKVMVKNLYYSYTITPTLRSSVSLHFPELAIGRDVVQILPFNHTINSTNGNVRYNATSKIVQLLLDTLPNRSSRGKGLSMEYEVCGGHSNERYVNVSLPTPPFYGFDKQLRCSYVYSCPTGYVPVLTLTVDNGTESYKSSEIEIYEGNNSLIQSTIFPLVRMSESFVGTGRKFGIVLNYDSTPPASQWIVFANFSFSKRVCREELGGHQGQFSSLTYGGKYPNNFTCLYSITTTPKTTILLTFIKVDLAGSDCKDYFEIRENDRSVVRVCNVSIDSYTSMGNKIQIYFETDGFGTAEGFAVTWIEQEIILPYNLAVIAVSSVIGLLFVVCVPFAVYRLVLLKKKTSPLKTDSTQAQHSTGQHHQQHTTQDDQTNGVYDCPWGKKVYTPPTDILYAEVQDFERDNEHKTVMPDK